MFFATQTMANGTNIFWVGSSETCIGAPTNVIAKLSTKKCCFYRKCIYGAMTLKVGDFVLISSAGLVDSDSVDSCEIGRITHLFEMENFFEQVNLAYQYQAIVQWYSRPEKIPHRLFDNDKITIDSSLELIEDHRAFDPVVSIYSIFQKCMIISGDPSDSATSLMPKTKAQLPIFICRYKIVKVAGNYQLIPLKDTYVDIRIQNRPGKEKTLESPTKKPSGSSASKKSRHSEPRSVNVEEKPLMSPIKIGRNSVIKLHRCASSSKISKTPAKMVHNSDLKIKPENQQES